MGEALAQADLTVVTDVYAAREAPIAGVSGALVAQAAERRGARVIYLPQRETLTDRVARLLEPGDVLLTLGAGDITRLGPEILARREAR